MGNSNRRSVLAALGASFALAGLATPVRLVARQRRISFPQEPLTLRRTLERELGRGAAIVVTRDWQVSFTPSAVGAKVEARQIACTVETPPVLAALAKVERERKVTGLFPMELDKDGQIAASGRSQGAGIEAAIEAASRTIAESAVDRSQLRDAKAYLATIGNTAAELVSQVPRDLFFPETGSRTQTRELDLPEGLKGTYEITVSAQACRELGLLLQSERRIVTRIGDTARTAREQWSILEQRA